MERVNDRAHTGLLHEKPPFPCPTRSSKKPKSPPGTIGVSRSRLVQMALEAYLERRREEELTAEINRNIEKYGDPSDGEEAWWSIVGRSLPAWNKTNEAGEIWWAGRVSLSIRARIRRPVVIVSANFLNESHLRTVLVVPVTANLTREHYRGNVRLPAGKATGPRKTFGRSSSCT
jgi:hypothetical protein